MKDRQGTVLLTTPRLMLRKFTVADADAMFSGWANDIDVARYMRWVPHANANETSNVIQIWVKSYDRDDFYLWAIEHRASGELIGSISLFCVNAHDQCYDVGYNIGKAHWNKGYVTEALAKVIEYGFSTGKINRIEAYHSVNNPGSGKVMQKCGMRYEGLSRQKYKSNAGFEDCDLYAILKSDSCD